MACYATKPVKQSDLLDVIMTALGEQAVTSRRSFGHAEVSSAGSCPLRILLAEDNEVNQKLAVRWLRKWGHSVVVAGNGRGAGETGEGRIRSDPDGRADARNGWT